MFAKPGKFLPQVSDNLQPQAASRQPQAASRQPQAASRQPQAASRRTHL